MSGGHPPHVKRMAPRDFRVVGLGSPAPIFESEEEAAEWLQEQLEKAPRAKRPAKRACLCCREEFMSAGFHNRLCPRCRGVSDALGEELRPSLPKSKRA